MTRVLILSISEIEKDARVLKQVRALVPTYEVTTCGLGTSPDSSVEHVRIVQPRRGIVSRLRPYFNAILLHLHQYRLLYWSDPFVRSIHRLLRARDFDVVVANDIDTVPVALRIAGADRVHVDLHEYFPGLHDDSAAWVRLRKPYYEWLIRGYAAVAVSSTTVAAGIASAYRQYGLSAGVVTNASPGMELNPSAVDRPIRLVHSGVAQPGRRLELTMRAVARSSADVTLDLFLMPSDERYLAQLATLAHELGPRISVRAPLAQAELVRTLNLYDVGVFVLPPTTGNNRHALPNKFFDFIQARLGIVIGPSIEMVSLVRKYELGEVCPDFSEESLVGVLDALTAEKVRAWKSHAHAIAHRESAEQQIEGWTRAVEGIVAAGTA